MPGSFSSQRKSRICPIDLKSGPRTIAWCATGAGNCQKTLDDLGKVKMKMKKKHHDSDSKGQIPHDIVRRPSHDPPAVGRNYEMIARLAQHAQGRGTQGWRDIPKRHRNSLGPADEFLAIT